MLEVFGPQRAALPGTVSPRVSRLFTRLGVVLALAIVLDIATCVGGYEGVREGDWVLLLPAVWLLVVALLRRPAAARLATGAVAVTGAVLVFECGAAVVGRDPGRPFAWYVWPPHYQCRVVPHDTPGIGQAGTFSTNSRGIRGREFSPRDAYRVLCVGGSTTECLYLDNSNSWPALVERALAIEHPRVWVGNLGRSSLTARDHATLLARCPEAREVECWVVLCGINDVGRHLAGEYASASAQTFERTFVYRRPGWQSPRERPLYRNTYTFHLVNRAVQTARWAWRAPGGAVVQDTKAAWYHEVRQKRARAPKVDQLPDLASAVKAYGDDVMAICRLAQNQQRRLLLVTQPVLWQDPMPREFEALCCGGWRADGSYYSSASLCRAMGLFNEELRRVARMAQVECVDLDDLLPKSTATLYDDCHFNEPGARAVARHISRALAAPTAAQWALPRSRREETELAARRGATSIR